MPFQSFKWPRMRARAVKYVTAANVSNTRQNINKLIINNKRPIKTRFKSTVYSLDVDVDCLASLTWPTGLDLIDCLHGHFLLKMSVNISVAYDCHTVLYQTVAEYALKSVSRQSTEAGT